MYHGYEPVRLLLEADPNLLLNKNYSEYDVVTLMEKCGFGQPKEEFPLRFKSPKHYFDSMKVPMVLDFWAQTMSEFFKTDTPKKHTLRSTNQTERFQMGLPSKTLDLVGLLDVDSKNIVLIENSGSPSSIPLRSTRFFGFIERQNRDTKAVDVLFSPNHSHIFKSNQEFHITEIGNMRQLILHIKNLGDITKQRGNQEIQDLFLDPKIEKFALDMTPLNSGSRFNPIQRRAFFATHNAFVAKPSSKVVTIQGPPGTGKSTLICGIIKHIIDLSENDPQPILVCAPSNGAVDSIAVKLMQSDYFDLDKGRFNLFRVGETKKFTTKKVTAYQEKLFERENIESPEQFAAISRVLKNSTVVLCTLGSSRSFIMKHFKTNPPKVLIIDEAGQSQEAETMLALYYNIPTVVLVGDHKQLPPTLFSQLAKRLGYRTSLMERLVSILASSETQTHITLEEQYRMLPIIMDFPSKRYYGGRLIAAPSAGINNEINGKIRSYAIIETLQSKETRISVGSHAGSVCNSTEARFLINLAVSILSELGHNPRVPAEKRRAKTKRPRLVILTFYRGQLNKFRELLEGKQEFNECIEVYTIDSFQGQEAEIVLLSTVRAPSDGVDPGFVKDEQRTNVALTRAKCALFISINSHSTIGGASPWLPLLKDAKQRNGTGAQQILFQMNTHECSKKFLHNLVSHNNPL